EGGAQFMTDACKELALRPIGTFDPLEPLLQLRLELLLLVDMLKRPDDAQKPPRSRLEERSGDHPYPECLFFLQFEPQFLARALPLQQALPASLEKRQILGMDELLELEARSALQQPLREGPSKPFQLEALPHGHVGESQVRRHLRDQAVALTRLVSISSGELLRLGKIANFGDASQEAAVRERLAPDLDHPPIGPPMLVDMGLLGGRNLQPLAQ